MDLAYVSLGALVVAILVSCFTELNVGVLALALAWVVGVYRRRHAAQRRHRRLSRLAVPHLVRGYAAVRAGAAEPHARSHRSPCRARLPRQCRAHSDHVFRARVRARVDGAGKRIDRGAAGSDGDGGGRARGDSRVPDDHHGRQRRAGRRALAVCADRCHRERPHGQNRPAGPRVVYLLDQSRGACSRCVRRLRAVWRPQAFQVDLRRDHRAQTRGCRVRYEQPDYHRGDRGAADRRAVLRRQRRHGSVCGSGRSSPLSGLPITRKRSRRCRGRSS